MSKTFRIIQLINLLRSRRAVTLKTIREVCGIPERTAYRYLNTISEANIPVYYDKDLNAYRLSTQDRVGLDDVSFGDGVLTVLALKVLQSLVNEQYQGDIDRLITKVLVRQQSEVEAVLGLAADQIAARLDRQDLSGLVSSALIRTAVFCNRKVQVTNQDETGGDRKVEFDHPGLIFRKSWQLTRKDRAELDTAPVEALGRVEIT